ncbi:MAG TPA: chromosome segregation protein SMC [Erysipelotrichaceae bacterium]|nr:chromosome segregation protein SMC [Erysipelotrichaceae bacterium]
MFLKRIEIQGFKSFADRVNISFDHPVTGVVGPNGCGKSNIVDAIRWVLGEQSVKSLRGSTMTDVIFTGSEHRRQVNFAEVTLVFDNSDRAFNLAFDEIEITRRLHRENAEGEYLINKVPCRLRDIASLTMDSGIGRDSLSLISQGTITSFSEAKPIDRRGIFEEAAGVAKYRKRKDEAINKLVKTETNLERINDIYLELQKQVYPLKKAAQKAEIYKTKKERLQKIEIAVLSDQITFLTTEIANARNELSELQAKEALLEASIQVSENNNMLAKDEISQLDQQLHHLQEALVRVVNEIQTLETRKIEIDEKRKYTLEVGNQEEKAIQVQSLLEEARREYEDRDQRLNQLNLDVQTLTGRSIAINRQLIDQNTRVEEAQSRLNRVQNRLEVAKNLESRPYMNQMGVQAIINASQSLVGVHGVVSKLLKPQATYEDAIGVALGGALYHIVTQDEASARQAINFLKKNESGRATFLPMSVLFARHLNREHEIVCQSSKGFLGTADIFVDCDRKFELVKSSLLGNVLVCDDLENGNHLAKLLNYQYKLVTLDGDVIHRGGSMTGGRQKDAHSPLSITKEINELKVDIERYQKELHTSQDQLFDLNNQKAELENDLMEKRIAAAQLEPVVDSKRAKFERLKADLDQLVPQGSEQGIRFEEDLIDMLNKAYFNRDDANGQLKTKRELRQKYAQESERRDLQVRQQRRDLSALQILKRDIEIQVTRQETNIENLMNRLSQDYQMTYEFSLTLPKLEGVEDAHEEVNRLRKDIEALGNINMLAPQEYETINARYEEMKAQYDEILESKDKILALIQDLDGIMVEQFKEMLDKINAELPEVIQAMFGGGKAYLALEDPNDYLNSGIEIHVQPPGKSIKNMRLFSGGEKSLIAISVLFAILKARHVPLCVFDEVEAALDQANVERFSSYLKKFSHSTQFVVLTHRPGTMAQCDVLFGVTMNNSGVSQMLKVRLADAMMLAEEVVTE